MNNFLVGNMFFGKINPLSKTPELTDDRKHSLDKVFKNYFFKLIFVLLILIFIFKGCIASPFARKVFAWYH